MSRNRRANSSAGCSCSRSRSAVDRITSAVRRGLVDTEPLVVFVVALGQLSSSTRLRRRQHVSISPLPVLDIRRQGFYHALVFFGIRDGERSSFPVTIKLQLLRLVGRGAMNGIVDIEKQTDFMIERIVFVPEIIVLVSEVIVLLLDVVYWPSIGGHAGFKSFQILSQSGYLGLGVCSPATGGFNFAFTSGADLSQCSEFLLQYIVFSSQFAVLLEKLLVFPRGIRVESRRIATRCGDSSAGSSFGAVGAFIRCQLRS